jgi:hypothetical protein
MAPASSNRETSQSPRHFGLTVPFELIQDPGTYICNWNGHLLRVPEDGVKSGRSPVIDIMATEPLMVTKLSDDPYIPITKARLLAADCDQPVSF